MTKSIDLTRIHEKINDYKKLLDEMLISDITAIQCLSESKRGDKK